MSSLDLATIAVPLLNFVQQLGLQPSDLSRRETPEVISFTAQVPNSKASALTPGDFVSIKQTYGAAFTNFAFSAEDEPGALLSLQLREQIDEARLEEFRREIASFDPYMSFLLNKSELVTQLIPSLPAHCRVLLYFFPQALTDLLSDRFDAIEVPLWPTNAPCKTIILLPTYDIYLDGPRLAFIGGGYLSSLDTIIPDSPPDDTLTKRMFDYCREHLLWQRD